LPRVRREPQGGVEAVAPLQPSSAGSSGSFLIRADDGNRYWCKSLNNLQNEPRVPVNEQLVARLGLLIGAPVCRPELVYIPAALVGWEIRPGSGRLLEEGWAHGSQAVDLVVETRDISANRGADDNRRRQAGIYALHDWCGGSDSQWLMAGPESEFHSHDHGHYFPGGPAWTIASLQGAAGTSYAIPTPPAGLDATELQQLAAQLEVVSEQDIATVASKIPAGWAVQDDELEALVDFIYDRRPQVAQRLRNLAGAV
jgi:hypothetical protein